MPNRTFSAVNDGSYSGLRQHAERPACDVAEAQWINTVPQKPRDRLAFWIDSIAAYSQAFVMPSTPVHDYRATALMRERSGITIMRLAADPLGFQRAPAHLARHADRVLLSSCLQAAGGIEAGGRFAQVADGAIYFQDCRGPGSFWTHTPLRETRLLVPRDWVVHHGKLAQDFDGAAFPPEHFLAKVLAQRIEAVADRVGDPDGAAFSSAVLGLRRSIEDAFAARHSDSHRCKLQERSRQLSQIRAYMCRHAGERDQTPDRIADALGFARSTLYRLLREEGLQLAAHVAEHRLVAIARMLRDPAWIGQPVGEIAARWGHHDQSYFARAFKRRFGETPSRWRARGPAPDSQRAHL